MGASTSKNIHQIVILFTIWFIIEKNIVTYLRYRAHALKYKTLLHCRESLMHDNAEILLCR